MIEGDTEFLSKNKLLTIEEYQDEVERVTGHRPTVKHKGSGWYEITCSPISMHVKSCRIRHFEKMIRSWSRRKVNKR